MPYQDKHSLLIDCMKTPYAWRSLNRLQDDLHQLQLLQFSCSFDRKGMRAILLSILSGTAEDSLEPVFDLHQRFPGCFNYVYLHAPKYVKATLGMLMALDHQDTPNELTVSDKGDRKSTRLNSSHSGESRMPSSA